MALISSPYVIAHRGGAWERPENTLAAFSHAMDSGVDGIELDIHLTQDHKLVVYHDFKLKRELTRDSKGEWVQDRPYLKDTTLEFLKTLDVGRVKADSLYAKRFPKQTPVDGEKIPELREVFSLAQEKRQAHLKFFIEVKFWPSLFSDEEAQYQLITQKLLEEIEHFNLEKRVVIMSFDWGFLEAFKKVNPLIERGYSTDESFHQEVPLPSLIHTLGGRYWVAFHKMLTPESLQEAHALGLEVLAWTPNTLSECLTLMEKGINGIITDNFLLIDKKS